MTHFESSVDALDTSDQGYEAFAQRFESSSKEELIKGLYSFIFNQSLKRYKKAKDIDVDPKARQERSSGRDRDQKRTRNGAQAGFNRYHITLGRQNGVEPGELIRLVSRNLAINGSEVGKISVMNDFSFFELPIDYDDVALKLNESTWKGESFKVQVAKESRGGAPRRGRGPRPGASRDDRPSRSRRYGRSRSHA